MTCRIVGANRDLVAFEMEFPAGIKFRAQCEGKNIGHLVQGLIRRDAAVIAACLSLDAGDAIDNWLRSEDDYFRIGELYVPNASWSALFDSTLLALLRHRLAAPAAVQWGTPESD